MGFPDDWLVQPLRHNSGMPLTWGKGITVHCGRWIGDQMRDALDGHQGDYRGVQIGEDEYDIDITNDYLPLSVI